MAEPISHSHEPSDLRCEWCGTWRSDGPVRGRETPPEPQIAPAPAAPAGLSCNAGAVVFVAMEGLATVAGHSAEALGPALEQISRCVQEAVDTHNGEWEGDLGSYRLFFSAVADDLAGAASRAAQATLELSGLLDECLQGLAARGVVIGPVFALHVAPAATLSAGERWQPLPEVLELGLELLAIGEHFSIVTSDAVVGAIGHLVRVVPLEASLSKDRGAVFELTEWQGAVPERPSWSDEGLSVACDDDIQVLLSRWQDVCDGGGTRFMTIVGPDGAGKRRLVEEFLTQAPGGRGLRLAMASASESTRLVPMSPLSEVVYRLIDVDPKDDDAQVHRRLRHACRRAARSLRVREVEREASLMAALIGRLFALEQVTSDSLLVAQLDADVLRKHGFTALRRLFQGLTMGSPRVVVLENLHEADAATLDFLDDFGSNSRGQGQLMLISTAQSALVEINPAWGRGWWRHETMTFEPLDSDELVELGESVVSRAGPVPGWLLEELADRADGDPMFMEQLTWLAAERGVKGTLPSSRPGAYADGAGFVDEDAVIDEDDVIFDEGVEDATELTWPDDLEATLSERVGELIDVHLEVLEVGALIGLSFPGAWVAAVLSPLSPEEVGSGLRTLEQRGFLRRRISEDTYRFRGEALWRVVRGRVSDEHQRVWNRKVARLLEADQRGDRCRGAYARVALHFQLGSQPGRAVLCYALAARVARRLRAVEEADACYTEALGLMGSKEEAAHSQERLMLCLAKGRLRVEAGDVLGAITDLEAAAQIAQILGDVNRQCEALFLLSAAYDRQGLLERAETTLIQVEARFNTSDNADPRLRVLHLRQAGWLRFRGGDKTSAQAFLERAADVARHTGVDLGVLASSIQDLSIVQWLTQNEESAIEGFSEVLSQLRRAGPGLESAS